MGRIKHGDPQTLPIGNATYDQAAFAMRGQAALLNFPIQRVRESLRELGLSTGVGDSPVLVLKRRAPHPQARTKQARDRVLSRPVIMASRKVSSNAVCLSWRTRERNTWKNCSAYQIHHHLLCSYAIQLGGAEAEGGWIHWSKQMMR